MMQLPAEKHSWPLDKRDPLYSHLALVTMPCAGFEVKDPDFEVRRLGVSQEVYVYKEQESKGFFVCKFFGSRWYLSEKGRRDGLNYEFKNLNTLRNMGFYKFPHHVVRPLSKDEKINCLLVEDFVRGHDLDYYIAKATYEGQYKALSGKLTELAKFLAKLHSRAADKVRVNFASELNYFRNLLDSLAHRGLIDPRGFEEFMARCNAWEGNSRMWEDVSVLVHGDATPTNFIFNPDDGVTAIDLERMHHSDRAYDIGMLAAELKHHFAWRVLKADAAEPHISRFIRAYCESFSDHDAVFKAITHRNQFYMALGELRIARNDWVPWEHRKWLVDEARRCLRF
jgi:aminoglycoside phosphotransferase (APT) family kinase protein